MQDGFVSIADMHINFFIAWGLLLAIHIGLKILIKYSMDTYLHIGGSIYANMYIAVMRQLFAIHPAEIEKKGNADVYDIVRHGLVSQIHFLRSFLSKTIPTLITLLALVIVLLYVSLYAVLAILIYILVIVLRFITFSSYKDSAQSEERGGVRVLHRLLYQHILTKFDILAMGHMHEEIDRVRLKLESVQNDQSIKNIIITMFRHDGMYSVSIIMCICVTGWAMYALQSGYAYIDIVYIIGSVFLLVWLMHAGYTDMMRLIDRYDHWLAMHTFLQSLPKISGYNKGESFVYKQGGITIENLSFGYDDRKIFDNFSLHIPPKKRIAIVGASGVGKSTLLKLIANYLQPSTGKIVIDGSDLARTKMKSYWRQIGYLPQEPQIFSGSISENLCHGVSQTQLYEKKIIRKTNLHFLKTERDFDLPSAIEDRIHVAIDLAQCQFIYDLPQGLDTIIGEGGVQLSLGQRQRIAIARIFLKDPQLVFLDEPTSSLDSISEDMITKAMHALYEFRTVVVVAHRLQTVRYADEIIVLAEDGEGHKFVAQRGNHQALISQKGLYATMVEMQTGL